MVFSNQLIILMNKPRKKVLKKLKKVLGKNVIYRGQKSAPSVKPE